MQGMLLQYNFLNEHLPQYDDLPRRLMRSAVIGFSASAISDTCSNSVRVVKTSKQTAKTPMTYPEVVRVSSYLYRNREDHVLTLRNKLPLC